MKSLVFLIPLALLLGGLALAAFFWSLRNKQYDDLQGAGERIFVDEDNDRAGAKCDPGTAPDTRSSGPDRPSENSKGEKP